MFASVSLSRVNNIRASLTNAQKGQQSVASYFAYMRGLADELAAAGKPLQDDELISYILNGLDMEYQPLVSALDARIVPVTLDEQAQEEASKGGPLPRSCRRRLQVFCERGDSWARWVLLLSSRPSSFQGQARWRQH